MDVKKIISDYIEENGDRLARVSDEIWGYAEVGMREFKSSKALIDELKKEGFEVFLSDSGTIAARFRERLDAGDDVLCVTRSSRLSGALRSAEDAATHVASDRVAVLDSWVTAGALEFLVRRARTLADGGCSLEEVVSDLTKLRQDTRIVFSVPDMAALSRSGRLGAIRRAVATKLNRYPVMRLAEGGIEQFEDGRGARGMAVAMAEQVPDGTTDMVVSHFGPRGVEAREVFLAARSRFPEARIRVKDGGPVLAEHLGLGAVGLSWA